MNNREETRKGGLTVQSAKILCPALIGAACVLTPACGREAPGAPPVQSAVEIRELIGAHARLVWCQDTGDGSDPGAETSRLVLMGLDTDDRRGERAILAQPSNYAKPLLTPRGDRVIFSNRLTGQAQIVNWDGLGLKTLADGFAVAVWREPATGREWVYIGTAASNSDGLINIRRLLIEKPEMVETVWNVTPINTDNFQLSVDGRSASGSFPWPHCGIAELPNGAWKKYGDGCWPSLAPDDTRRFWIFDGAHRNLTMFLPGSGERWEVNLNGAPGIGGFEVYHPRWSNHPRFMIMTGPYKAGEGDNRIRAGGREVEIYIGRFDPEFKRIERWSRATHNERGDFFPDLWVEPAAGAATNQLRASTPDRPEPPAKKQVAAAAADWPGNTDALIYLWENRSKQNEIRDAAGKPRFCRAEPRGRAKYGRFFEMDLTGGAFIAEGVDDLPAAACRNSGRLGLEAVLTPKKDDQRGPVRIISLSSGADAWNFILGQSGSRLYLCLQTVNVETNKPTRGEINLCTLAPGTPQHVIVSCADGKLSCFLNGKRVFDGAYRGDFSSWSPQPLVFGGAPTGACQWAGALEGIAVYARAIGAEEAARKYAACSRRLAGRQPLPRLALEARLIEASRLPTPESISPYRRALAVNRYRVEKLIEGRYAEAEIMVAHWVIMDGAVLSSARRERDTVQRLTVEPFDGHPELEGERLIMDSDEFHLPLYYDIGNN